MHYFLYPTQDTFITNNPNLILKNTGLDEILQIEKTLIGISFSSSYIVSGSNSGSWSGSYISTSVNSRALLQFDVSSSLASREISGSATFYLNLKVAQSVQVPVNYNLISYPLSSSWSMGTGYVYDGNQTADGANWKFTDGVVTPWFPTETQTGKDGGGSWLTSSMGIQYFKYQTSDVRMDVTDIVNEWISGFVPNNGFIVMHSNENDGVDYGKLRFFSKETNTIYSPYLEVVWDDSIYNPTASIDTIYLTEAVVSIKNMMPSYRRGSVIKFNVTPRYRYPLKTFTNMLSSYLEPYYLPSSSFYSIKDAESAEIIIPYDEGTRISADSWGNHFYLDMSGLCEERYYKIEIKSEQSGSVVTFDIPTPFKIIR